MWQCFGSMTSGRSVPCFKFIDARTHYTMLNQYGRQRFAFPADARGPANRHPNPTFPNVTMPKWEDNVAAHLRISQEGSYE
jgi:hypothetical protein